jgi:hypothetical protein
MLDGGNVVSGRGPLLCRCSKCNAKECRYRISWYGIVLEGDRAIVLPQSGGWRDCCCTSCRG